VEGEIVCQVLFGVRLNDKSFSAGFIPACGSQGHAGQMHMKNTAGG
jgi:hypothetical protein